MICESKYLLFSCLGNVIFLSNSCNKNGEHANRRVPHVISPTQNAYP